MVVITLWVGEQNYVKYLEKLISFWEIKWLLQYLIISSTSTAFMIYVIMTKYSQLQEY